MFLSVVLMRDQHNGLWDKESTRKEIKARLKVIHNIGVPKDMYFCLRCCKASGLALTCCLRRLQTLGGSYMPTSCEYPGLFELAGMEVITFIVTCMVLCFEVVPETVLITQGWFMNRACTASAFCPFPTLPRSE